MVKHLVMWKLQPGYERKERAAAIREQANRLLAPIEGVLRLEVWEGYLSKEIDHEVALYIEFVDSQAEKAYGAHPNHQAFKAFIKDCTRDRVAIDTEL